MVTYCLICWNKNYTQENFKLECCNNNIHRYCLRAYYQINHKCPICDKNINICMWNNCSEQHMLMNYSYLIENKLE